MAAVDNESNLVIYSFNPLDKFESRGMQYLIPTADFHLGNRCNRLLRLKLQTARHQLLLNNSQSISRGPPDLMFGAVLGVSPLHILSNC